MQKWEYLLITRDDIGVSATGRFSVIPLKEDSYDKYQPYRNHEWWGTIERLGNDGWEMVSVISNPTNNKEISIYFKRPKE